MEEEQQHHQRQALLRAASSNENLQPWHPHPLGSGASRKARSSVLEPETGGGNVERSSVSMPPPASQSLPRQYPARYLSKSAEVGGIFEPVQAEPVRGANLGVPLTSTLTSTLADAYRHTRSEPDVESNRLSFSSLYSIGSTNIYPNNARRMSTSLSAAGSEPDGEPLHSATCFLAA